jgi:hypothetical protein
MTRTHLQWQLIAAAFCAMMAASLNTAAAQEPKQLHEKHDSTALYKSLGEVINLGAKLFNDQSDYAGCYRLFQGSLLSVRPFLAGDLQKKIDKGLASAEMQSSYADRAWELRGVLDDVRRQLKPAEAKIADKKEDKKIDEKKVEEKKSSLPDATKKLEEKKSGATDPAKKADDKKSAAPDPAKGQLAGKVTFQGQPVTGGYFVTLVRDDKRVSSTLQKDGSFQFTTPIAPGEYAIAIEPIRGVAFAGVALPQRYETEKTSGLTITVQGCKQQVDLSLVK